MAMLAERECRSRQKCRVNAGGNGDEPVPRERPQTLPTALPEGSGPRCPSRWVRGDPRGSGGFRVKGRGVWERGDVV